MKKNDPFSNKKFGITCIKFDFVSAKYFIMAAIIMFHIVPLLLMFSAEAQTILYSIFMVMLNPLFLLLEHLIYSARHGFNFKLPLISSVLGALSIVMYYYFQNSAYMLMTGIAMLVVYLVISLVGAVVGGFVKSYL